VRKLRGGSAEEGAGGGREAGNVWTGRGGAAGGGRCAAARRGAAQPRPPARGRGRG
jgi:hypothetical protein